MSTGMKLPRREHMYLEAAEGWLELGNYAEANEELERITPRLRAHPDVLRVRYEVFAKARKWEIAAEIARAFSEIVPLDSFGFIHLANALHEMKRTREALDVLLPILNSFPGDETILYDAARYFAQLGDRKSAWACLEQAIDMVGSSEIKLRALDDPDLEPLWLDIAEI